MKIKNGVTLFSSAIFLPVLALGFLALAAPTGIYHAPLLHSALQLFGLFFSLGFIYLSYRAIKVTGSQRLISLSIGLLWSGFLFLAHAIADEKGALVYSEWFHYLAIFISALFFFLAVNLKEHTIKPSYRRAAYLFAVFSVLVGVILNILVVRIAVNQEIFVFASLSNWTPLGRFLQMVSEILLVAASIRYLHDAFRIKSEISLLFAVGIFLFAFSEITLAQGRVEHDLFFWIAHVWRLVGYFAFFWGLLIAGRDGLTENET